MILVKGSLRQLRNSYIVQIGMRRSQVEHMLGKAIVPELQHEEMERKGVTDACGELYQGAFAWITYGGETEQVVKIEFTLCDFQRKFGAQLTVLLQIGNVLVPFRAGLTKKDVEQLLRNHPIHRLQHGTDWIEMVSSNAVCSFYFDKRKELCTIEITSR